MLGVRFVLSAERRLPGPDPTAGHDEPRRVEVSARNSSDGETQRVSLVFFPAGLPHELEQNRTRAKIC